jgi:hypothetical protein
VSTTGQDLLITSDDVDLQVSSSLSGGDAVITITTEQPKTVGVGVLSEQFDLDLPEMQRIHATGLTIGQAGSIVGSILVQGISEQASSGISDAVAFIAAVDDSRIRFSGVASTFSAVTAQADNGISVDTTIIATTGAMHLDGDMDKSNTDDNDNSIFFAESMTVQAKTYLTLEAITGTVSPNGALTLKAGAGIFIYNDITSIAEGKALVFDADYESYGDGNLRFMPSKVLDTKGGTVQITAADVSFGGAVRSDALTVHMSTGGTMGLGYGYSGTRNLTITSDDLQSINAVGFTLGSHVNGDITVSGVTAVSSNNIQGIVSLVATGDDARISFKGLSSTFNALAVQADNGIDVHTDVNTDVGSLNINGDFDASNTDDAQNTVSFAGDTTLNAIGLLYVNGTSSGMHRSADGTLTFQSETGIVLSAGLTSAIDNQKTIIKADAAGGVWSPTTGTGGIGVLTVAQPALLRTQNGQLFITASDVDLKGAVDTGTQTLALTVSRPGSIIGLGNTADTANGYTLSSSELQRVSSVGLVVGNDLSGSIEVADVKAEHSKGITGVVSLAATRQNAAISFTTGGSVFGAVVAIADDGIDMDKSLTTTLGSIVLNGDADDADDARIRDFIAFGQDVYVTSALDIDMRAATGGMILTGPVWLYAKRHISIHNKFTGPFGSHPVIVEADTDNDGRGTTMVSATACSIYTSAPGCVASRLCAWCGNEAKTVGEGLVTTTGTTGTSLKGDGTTFMSDAAFVVGNLLTLGGHQAVGQSRVITSIESETLASIESKFLTTPSGLVTIYPDALHEVVGSVPSRFTREVKPGYSLTAGNSTATVVSIQNASALTLNTTMARAAANAVYTIGNIPGAGSVSTDSAMSNTVTGSWSPSATKFLTQLKPGSVITVGSQIRTVKEVSTNQVITVTTPFKTAFKNMPYAISNIAGAGTLTFGATSTSVTGSTLSSTEFTKEIHVGDVVTINGVDRIVKSVTDDQHMTMTTAYDAAATTTSFGIGNVHNAPFNIAAKASGTVYTVGKKMFGTGTLFAAELEMKFAIFVKVGSVYEKREVNWLKSETELWLDTALSVDIASNAQVSIYYQTCPKQYAGTEENQAGTLALHAKAKRPNMCYNTGRCVPRASTSKTVETSGQGILVSSTNSPNITGIGSDFVAQLKPGYTISVNSGNLHESREIMSVNSMFGVTLERPFSFDINTGMNLPFNIHYKSGQGVISNSGGSNYTVYGSGTFFKKDLAPGFVVMVGAEKRIVTAVLSETEITISAPFNHMNGGVTNSGFAFEACMSGTVATTKQLTVEYAELDPGCCGFKSLGSVSGANFAYYKVVPPSTNYNLRVVTTSATPNLEVYMRYTYAPDAVNYDFQAVGTTSPWQIELPQSRLRCPSNATSCDSLWVGVKAPFGLGSNINFEVAAYLEFNFPSFACSESSEASASARCAALGLKQLGNATFVNDASDVLNPNVMRLTSDMGAQKGAVWYNTQVHLENGFETAFTFKMSSACTTSEPGSCGAGDGFAFVIHSSGTSNTTATDDIGCGGSSLGFADDAKTACTGIKNSFAVEFDTWHNPELRDINIRGMGTVESNATTSVRNNFVHAAFFSGGENSTPNSHDRQLAGTPAIPAIDDGQWHTARVVYIPGTSTAAPGRMFLYIDDMQSFVLTAPIRLTREGACGTSVTDKCVLDPYGNAFLGFTASTGGKGQNHDISKWLFCDEPGCGRE